MRLCASILPHLQAEILPTVSGTPGNQQTRDYIVKTLGAVGIKAVEQPFEAKTPLGVVKMANIVATLPGTRPERIILGSHFDTNPKVCACVPNDGPICGAVTCPTGQVCCNASCGICTKSSQWLQRSLAPRAVSR